MKNICNQKGITMIGLVITIAVTMILVGVVVAIVYDEDTGTIKQTLEATSGVENFSLYESISELIVTSKKKNGKIDSATFPTKVSNIADEVSCSYDENTSKYTVTVSGVEKYEVSEYGKITEK